MRKFSKKFLALALVGVMALSMSVTSTTEAAAKAPKKITLSTTKKSFEVGSKVTVKVKKVTPKKASKAVKFKTSNKKIATVNSKGVVTGKKAGKVTITATSKKNKKVKAKIKLTVKKKTPVVLPTALTIKTNTSKLEVGKKCNVTVTGVTPSNAANKSVTYTSSDSSVATVTQQGEVSGLKEGTVNITVTSQANKNVKATVKIDVVVAKVTKGTVTTTLDLSDETKYPQGKVAKVWLPIPQSDENQTITDVTVVAPNATTVNKEETNLDSAGNRVVYIEWGTAVAPAERKATVSFHAERKEVVCPALIENGTIDKTKFAKYLEETEQSGGIGAGSYVKGVSDKIVADAKAVTVLDKSRAIFDWVVNNLHRDDSVTGCGLGKVETILKGSKGGKCTDINSVFVALLRSQGIPARDMFGIRMNTENITKNQHCRAQFYLPGTGWVEADPADVLKKALGDKKDSLMSDWSTYIEPVKAQYWGGNNSEWVMLSEERDITLSPAQSASYVYGGILNEDGTLNNFGYPYGEFDGEYVECYLPTEFVYTYGFQAD